MAADVVSAHEFDAGFNAQVYEFKALIWHVAFKKTPAKFAHEYGKTILKADALGGSGRSKHRAKLKDFHKNANFDKEKELTYFKVYFLFSMMFVTLIRPRCIHIRLQPLDAHELYLSPHHLLEQVD